MVLTLAGMMLLLPKLYRRFFQEIVEDLGVYIVSIDRPGYGESDPDPNRTVKSLALDIEELADQLRLGSKFYVIGFSMGGQVTWGCLKHIPHRLAGAVLLAPAVNYWWTGFPTNLSSEAYNQQLLRDQWALRVAHYTPLLTYWWNTQKWFPVFSIFSGSPDIVSDQDKQLIPKIIGQIKYPAQTRQQGEYESIHRDLIIGFGSWEFSPVDLENPFPNNEGSVHLWHGDEDRLVPVTMQRYIVQKLPWIEYHEVPGAGHLFPHADGLSDSIIKALLNRGEIGFHIEFVRLGSDFLLFFICPFKRFQICVDQFDMYHCLWRWSC
ncbi:Alpha/beta-Hydrolases superfamily protein [Quillaja saponaria]|uniref:Alpha/beta-Hydrolases superfamily protein n=1 Tax=Quillaja saponaria TaxID=32244 RepID=A0AAD7Q756_QUISA|nr:Alpha/beta-Hydrolases superfamily protein [Quillaja saponaria]